MRAERRTGELLKETTKRTGGDAAKASAKASSNQSREHKAPAPLADLGISYDQSSQWQKLAEVPQETFEEVLADTSEPISAQRVKLVRSPTLVFSSALGRPPGSRGTTSSNSPQRRIARAWIRIAIFVSVSSRACLVRASRGSRA
ncbi:hypothetical protein PSAC2689_200002 [Paraburkholderia sacchari]